LVDEEMTMARTNKHERIALGAMVIMVVASLLVVAQGYIGLGFLLFFAAATPLPVFASIRARRSREAPASEPRDGIQR
jgi:hypothetical protein